ncbi:Uncharacterized protein GBIM_20255 [Gryllus bimaculatus]|nr:Uncharacterized protein GBIM_20255 [Gryllus bimaculatus]
MRGVELQFKLAALVALRARRRGVRVRLWARAGSARPFDDLVLRLAAPAPAAPATLYVQLWHAKGQLAEKDFVEEGKKTYLGKYFTFFRKLRTLFAQKSTLPEGNEDSCILAEGSLDNVLCVLYTTKDLPAERPLPQASTTGVLAELENLLRTDTRGAEDCGFFFTAEDTQLFKEWLQDENSNYCIDENFPDVEWVLARDVRRQARQVAGEGLITFKDSYCFTLKEALCANHLRIIVPGIPVGLRAAKLLQVLDCDFPSRWLYANPQLLIQFPASVFVALCKRTWVDILVIDTDEVNPGLNEVISAVLSKVKLVEVCSVAHSEGTSCVQQLEEEWEMEHLVCRSEEKLLDRPVHYQGLYVRLGDLVPKWVKNPDPQLSQLIPQTSMLMHTEVFIASATSARLQRVKGGAMMHGVELEIKLAALVALRARRARLPFELFTKAIIAKPFSDLVLRVNAQPSHVGGATVFVDLLHSKGQLDVEDFVEKEKRTHMGKYFDFYERLQNLFSSGTGLPGIEEDDGVLYESSKGEVLLVLYTTKEGSSLKPQLQPLKDSILPVLEDIFKTNGEQSAFSFTPEDEQVWNLFEGENCEKVKSYKHEFLPRFRVLCNQLHAENLDGLIAEELNGLFGCHLPNARYHQMDYVQLLREWSQDPDSNYCLSEESGDLEWVLAQDIRRHARLAAGDGAVVFREDGCAELRKALEQGHLRVIVPGVPEGIRAAKLLQLLDQEFADRWLYTSAELLTQFPAPLLTALCKAPQVEVLVIDANEVSQSLGDVINAVLDMVKLVRVCSVTHSEAAPKMGQLVEIWRLEHIKRNVEDKEEKDILDRTVLYQGSLVQLRDLVPMWAVPPRPVLKDASHQTSAKSTEFSNPSHVKMISENSFADKDKRFHLPRMPGTANSFGLEFEYKIAGLLALRARRSGLRFQLFLNVAAAFPFDDIVLRIYAPQPALYLVQIKHMVSRRLMTSRDFTRKGNFSLEKYFRSFEKLRYLHRNREINMREDDRWLIDVPLENNWFVLLTTAGVSGFKPSQALSSREQIPHEYLFLTSCGGANDIIRFGPEDVEVWNLFKDNEELKIYQDGFLSQLVLFVNQVTSDKVDSLILHEIKLLLCPRNPRPRPQESTCQSVCFNYINWLKSWSEGSAGFCLTESSHEIEKAVVYHFQKWARAKDLCHVFAFENAYCSHLDAALVQNKSIELVVLGVPPGIRAAKLLERLDHVVSDGWMYVDDEVWKELSADILVKVALAVRVVVLDFQHEAEAQKLMQAVGDAVQVVMLYSSPKDGIECHRTGSVLCIEEDWKLEHLTMEAQEKLLDSHVLFQGDSVPLRALEAAWPRVRQEADGALLGALARGDAALGAALPGHAEDERLYIPRGLQHPSALCASALRLASAADHLALQGFAPRALRRLQDALGWSDEEARQRISDVQNTLICRRCAGLKGFRKPEE